MCGVFADDLEGGCLSFWVLGDEDEDEEENGDTFNKLMVGADEPMKHLLKRYEVTESYRL